jgi:hypothetical protein
MSAKYTFTVLRYVHDVVAGEFANVGVALYAPEAGFLGCICATTYGRLSRFFPGVEGDHIKKLLRHIQTRIDEMGSALIDRLPLPDAPGDATSWIARVLPPDDSSLQFSAMGAGLSDDPGATLQELFHRYVALYQDVNQRISRIDEEIWPVFRQHLAQRNILSRLQPKRIAAKDYEHEFPHAWKNGVWNACEAISFDLMDSADIVEKANRWLGRTINLFESQEKFRLHLLLGKPRLAKQIDSFYRAQNILHKMPCPHDLFTEEEAEHFADFVQSELKTH